jgi:hypothetical protein
VSQGEKATDDRLSNLRESYRRISNVEIPQQVMAIKPVFKPRLSGNIPQTTKCLTQLIFCSRPSNPFSLRCVWSMSIFSSS